MWELLLYVGQRVDVVSCGRVVAVCIWLVVNRVYRGLGGLTWLCIEGDSGILWLHWCIQ